MWGDISLWFWCAFPWWLMMFSHLCIFFGRMCIQILCPFIKSVFFLWLLSCMSSLYILVISPSSDSWFVNIYSHSVGCLFILLMVSFDVQSFLVWCSPTYLIFNLRPISLMNIYANILNRILAFHPKAAEYTFFSSAHAGPQSLSKFKKIEIISSIFFNHNTKIRNQLQEKKNL